MRQISKRLYWLRKYTYFLITVPFILRFFVRDNIIFARRQWVLRGWNLCRETTEMHLNVFFFFLNIMYIFIKDIFDAIKRKDYILIKVLVQHEIEDSVTKSRGNCHFCHLTDPVYRIWFTSTCCSSSGSRWGNWTDRWKDGTRSRSTADRHTAAGGTWQDNHSAAYRWERDRCRGRCRYNYRWTKGATGNRWRTCQNRGNRRGSRSTCSSSSSSSSSSSTGGSSLCSYCRFSGSSTSSCRSAWNTGPVVINTSIITFGIITTWLNAILSATDYSIPFRIAFSLFYFVITYHISRDTLYLQDYKNR